jgi:hypothetical protein
MAALKISGLFRYKIGLIEADAMDVVIIYGLLEIARDGVARLMTYRTPDEVCPRVVLKTAEAFLEACKYARNVLPKLRTGLSSHDDRDAELEQRISAAASAQPANAPPPSAPVMQH